MIDEYAPVGTKVVLSDDGTKAGFSYEAGVVSGHSKARNQIRVTPDNHRHPATFHVKFWDEANPIVENLNAATGKDGEGSRRKLRGIIDEDKLGKGNPAVEPGD